MVPWPIGNPARRHHHRIAVRLGHRRFVPPLKRSRTWCLRLSRLVTSMLMIRAAVSERAMLDIFPNFNPGLVMGTFIPVPDRHIPRVFHVRDIDTLLHKSQRRHETGMNRDNPQEQTDHPTHLSTPLELAATVTSDPFSLAIDIVIWRKLPLDTSSPDLSTNTHWR